MSGARPPRAPAGAYRNGTQLLQAVASAAAKPSITYEPRVYGRSAARDQGRREAVQPRAWRTFERGDR